MGVSNPWELVTVGAVPISVAWWPLKALPTAPVTVASLQGLRLAGIRTDVEYGPAQIPQPGQVAYRSFTADFVVPLDGTVIPEAPVVGLALVDTDGAGTALTYLELELPQSLTIQGDGFRLVGYLQATAYP